MQLEQAMDPVGYYRTVMTHNLATPQTIITLHVTDWS